MGKVDFVDLYIYKHFEHYLNTSKKRYLGHPLEDFVDDPRNHNLYDMTFCNNVFYYVGFGKNKIGQNTHT